MQATEFLSCPLPPLLQVTDNNEKNQLALVLKGPAPLGAFINPAPIASLPFTGHITVGGQACKRGATDLQPGFGRVEESGWGVPGRRSSSQAECRGRQLPWPTAPCPRAPSCALSLGNGH